jgi:hypothetical protein
VRQILALLGTQVVKRYYHWAYPSMRIAQMRACHLDDAARLLTTEFCRREPLSKALGLKESDLYDFFYAQAKFSAERGYGLVVERKDGRVIAAITIEDHLDPMPIDPSQLAPGVVLIGEILDAVKIPVHWEPETRGEVFYCGIGAVDHEFRNQKIMTYLVAGTYLQMARKGFRMGYAKISNKALVKNLLQIQAKLHLKIFTVGDEKTWQQLPQLAPYNLKTFKLTLMGWPVMPQGFETDYVVT